MTEQDEVKRGPVSVDEPTAREMMDYYRVNHDEFVKYLKRLGIKHDD